MIKIGICEDNLLEAEKLKELVTKFLFRFTEMEILFFRDGQEIVNAISEKRFQVDLLFLDIHMQTMDGMETAQFIRKHGVDVDIIFTTISKEHVFEGYNYKAFAYCLKPIDEEKLQKDLERYIEEKGSCADCFNITVKNKEIRIPINKIIYFESDKRKITVHTLTDHIEFYARMDEVENIVKEKGFFRCHQSYMVNRSMVDSMERTEIIAQGFHIPMSRKYYEGLNQNEAEENGMRLTHSLALNQEKMGAIVFVKGKLTGAIIRIRPEREIVLGRDGSQSDIVISERKISRKHCSITYNSDTSDYTICDYSRNGLYSINGEAYPKDMPFSLPAGTEIVMGMGDNIFCLG